MTTAENIKKLENGTKVKVSKINNTGHQTLAVIKVGKYGSEEFINISEGSRLTFKKHTNEYVFGITGFSDNVEICLSEIALNMCEFEIE